MKTFNKISTMLLIISVAIALVITACGKKGDGSADGAAAPAAGADADVEKGKQLYAANACNSCHGASGKGDGPAGAALKPPPRNFADLAGYKQGSSVEAIAKTLETGVANTPMVSYKHVSEADRMLIAKFVVELQKQ